MLVDEGHRPDARIVYNIRNNWRAGILPGCIVDGKRKYAHCFLYGLKRDNLCVAFTQVESYYVIIQMVEKDWQNVESPIFSVFPDMQQYFFPACMAMYRM